MMRSFVISLLVVVSSMSCVGWAQTGPAPAGAATTSPETYDVTIVFLGLMTFKTEPQTVTVIIPNVKNGHPALGNDGHAVHKHVPYILARTAAIASADPLNEGNVFDEAANEKTEYHYLTLKGEKISLDDENQVPILNGPLSYTIDAPKNNGVCPDKDTSRSLYWIPSMTTITTHEQEEDPEYFKPRPDKKTIAGRALLQYGSLGTRVITGTPSWEFRTPVASGAPGQPIHTQAIAQEVHWTFKATGVPFVLNLLSFDGKNSRSVAFTPDPNTKKLLLIIGNTTKEDTGPLQSTGLEYRDDHYSVYHLSAKGNSIGYGPIPHLNEDLKKCDPAYQFPSTLQPASSSILSASALKAHAHAAAHQQAGIVPAPFLVRISAWNARRMTGDPAPSGLNCGGNRWK